MSFIEHSERIPVRKGYEVLVAGGGVAGVAAALSAARNGRKVLLLEKTTMLGGLGTIGLINFFVPMCNGRGKQIIFGMAEEFLRMSVKYGYDTLPDEWREPNGPSQPTEKRYVTRYSPQIFALVMLEMLHDEGVDVLYDCQASQPVMNGTHCRGIITESKSGREFIPAEIVIDTTGDADVLARSGMPTIQGKNYYTYAGHAITIDSCKKAVETNDIRYAISGRSGGGANLYGGNHPADMPFFMGTNVDDVNDYLQKNQLFMLSKLKKENRRARDVITLPTMCQFRTTRHIDGDYTLLESDCYKHFDDSVAAINDFDRRDFLYEVPLRTLTRRGYDNLLTAGRSASGDGYAWDVLRVIPPAIVTGQAVGLVASMALESGKPVADVDIKELQNRLSQAGLLIHFDDALVPADRKVERDTSYDHF